MVKILLSLIFVLAHFRSGGCLVILQRSATFKLPYDFPVGTTFLRLQVVDEKTGETPVGPLNFHVLKSVEFPGESKLSRGLFAIDEHTGSLMLSPHRKHSIAEFKGSTFALDLVAVSSSEPSEISAHATVVISIVNDSFAVPNCTRREELCFSSGVDIQYQVPESIAMGSLIGNLNPIPYEKLCPNIMRKYIFDQEDTFINVSAVGDLKNQQTFDYEENAYHEWNISCEISNKYTFHSRIRMFVLDVDDNAPYVQNSTDTYQEIDISQIKAGKQLPVQLTVLDSDSPSVNKITVNLTDPLKLFHLRDTVFFHGVNGDHMLINTALVPKAKFRFPDTSYNVSVTFNDTSLITKNLTGELVFHVLISNKSSSITENPNPFKEFQVVKNVFRHSSYHARVIQPMEVTAHEGYYFRLLKDKSNGILNNRIFGVTPNTGIVFISDEVSLAKSLSKMFRLELTWRNHNSTDRRCIVLVRVLDSGDPKNGCDVKTGQNYPSCSLHSSAETCSSSCGRGANGGFCQWRSQSSPTLVDEYATCSPHLKTCPDGTCDELEEMDPLLCPQDCAGNVQGEAIPSVYGRGIGKAAAPCTCTGPNTCVCVQFPSMAGDQKLASRSQTKTSKDISNIRSKPLEVSEHWGGCGLQCRTMIIVSLVTSGLIVLAGGALLYHRKKHSSKSNNFPTARTPLNSCSHLCNTGAPDNQNQLSLVGGKLEFPRDCLVLEETLGEGEFGKVVKGKAKNIAKLIGTTTVAVKMLKDGSSMSEKCDLIAELNLLKEITHPNVISVLGACTDESGPLYVIMEYAEHGSLITYLREMQAKDVTLQEKLPELLSYALQIAKGMEYLASMKVVHRDLAARNVLVASGKTMKISDFGLSRDVYEGETYLKTSHGKVPVKWMALESLANHTYTTKSDVWSYSILLWEIITFGSCPYPGIPIEQLFELLKDGYRMPKPVDCPIQLYEIMQACWLEKPKERPYFKELVQKIGLILSDVKHSTEKSAHHIGKMNRTREEGSVLQQLSSFPKLGVQRLGPYENQCLLSPSELSV